MYMYFLELFFFVDTLFYVTYYQFYMYYEFYGFKCYNQGIIGKDSLLSIGPPE